MMYFTSHSSHSFWNKLCYSFGFRNYIADQQYSSSLGYQWYSNCASTVTKRWRDDKHGFKSAPNIALVIWQASQKYYFISDHAARTLHTWKW